jgi:hypothetical protein
MRHRLVLIVTELLRQLFRILARAVVVGLLFTTCLVLTLRYLGIPVPSPFELLHDFEGLSKLAKILS